MKKRKPGILIKSLFTCCTALSLASVTLALPSYAAPAAPIAPKATKQSAAGSVDYRTANIFRINFDTTRPQRVLNFPKDFSLGQIIIGRPDESEQGALQGAARGQIIVPAGKFVSFVPAARFYQNPAIINTFAPDAFDCLQLAAVSLDDAEDGLCDRALSYVGHLKGLLVLNLDKSDATDKGAVYAGEITNLQKITAFQSTIGGECFKHFGALKQLRCVRLPSNGIKDENVKYLSSVPHLQYLTLGHTTITNRGVQGLVNCIELTHLELCTNPRITDECIKSILQIKKLRALNLADTSVTTHGVMQLKPLMLRSLRLPRAHYSQAELKSIKQGLPGVDILLAEDSRKTLDDDMTHIFAPLR